MVFNQLVDNNFEKVSTKKQLHLSMFIVYHRTIISNGKACDVGQRKVSDLNIVKSNTL